MFSTKKVQGISSSTPAGKTALNYRAYAISSDMHKGGLY